MKLSKKLKAVWMTGALVSVSALAFWGASPVSADEKDHDHDHDHDHAHHDKVAGPNGGRVIHSVDPHLEFLVTKDRKVRINALGEDLKKVVPIGEDLQIVFVGGSRTEPTRLTFSNEEGALVSSGELPAGKSFPAVLQIKAGGERIMEKFQLDLNECPTCDFLEYACICDHHHHGEGHDHDHDHDHDHGKTETRKPSSPLKKR